MTYLEREVLRLKAGIDPGDAITLTDAGLAVYLNRLRWVPERYLVQAVDRVLDDWRWARMPPVGVVLKAVEELGPMPVGVYLAQRRAVELRGLEGPVPMIERKATA